MLVVNLPPFVFNFKAVDPDGTRVASLATFLKEPANTGGVQLRENIKPYNGLAVSVLQRQLAGYTFRMVVPAQYSGGLSSRSRLFQEVVGLNRTTAQAASELDAIWIASFTAFQAIPLADGDTIELGPVEIVPLFRRTLF